MSQMDGIVHLGDLLEAKVYVRLNDSTQKRVLAAALELYGTYSKLRKEFKVSRHVIEKLYRDKTKSMSLKLLKCFSEFLYERSGASIFKMENLEKTVLYLRSVGANSGKLFNPPFPLNFNCSHGGTIIGGLMGDGGIREDCRPFYANSDKGAIQEMIVAMKKVVGDFKTGNMTMTNSGYKPGSVTYSYDFHKIIGYILFYGLGIKAGGKMTVDPSLPKFSFNACLDFKVHLIKKFFTDEATPHAAGTDLAPQISLRQVKPIVSEKDSPPKRLVDINELLKSLGLKPVIFLEDSYIVENEKRGVYNLSISKINDTRFFSEKIGFSSKSKEEKLKTILNETTRKTSAEEYFRNKTLNSSMPVLSSIEILREKNEEITSQNISKIVGRSVDSVRLVLNRPENRNILKITNKGNPLKGKGHTCDVFELTDKGEESIRV